MIKKILFVLALNLILVGCSQAPIAYDGGPLADCKKQTRWFCMGNPQNPSVILHTNTGKLKASPYCVKANRGTQIRFELKPKGNKPLNTVHIVPKNPADNSWLARSNSADPDLITVDVPQDIDETIKHYYGFKTDTDCVDPRINIKN